MLLNRLVIVGFFLVLIGAVLPFVIAIGLVASTFLLNFIAFAASVSGVFLGLIGTAMYVSEKRRQDKWHNH